MLTRGTIRRFPSMVVVFFLAGVLQAQQVSPIQYKISLFKRLEHLVHVQISLGPGASERQLQLPVWNALYQVRDFAQYINWVKATDFTGNVLSIQKLDKSSWRISNADRGAVVEYEIYADVQGPYGAQLNEHHTFLNLAEILMYEAGGKAAPVVVEFTDLLPGWKVATPLSECGAHFCASNYDQMVDSPVEVGSFSEQDFEEGGARYRVVVDADPADYEMDDLVKRLRAIVRAATEWMGDRPYETYTFIYHFPRQPSDGGMEHAYGTAIDVTAALLKDNPEWFNAVSAHEFFHLWNVKRIRPATLEPVDYMRENYTRALWFSEGVTSTVQGYILLQSGLMTADRYLELLGEQITTLEMRSGHRDQSAEESSLDAWLEKYPYYREPGRSISYYNKGELLGVLLDLKVRESTAGKASLRKLFQWMNENYAKKGNFFEDSQGVQRAAETVCKCELTVFFRPYVAGTAEIPWDSFFSTVGLKIEMRMRKEADPGFAIERAFGGAVQVTHVERSSEAAQAGVRPADQVLSLNDRIATGDPRALLTDLHPGEPVKLRVRRQNEELEMNFKCGTQASLEYRLREVDKMSAAQRVRRVEWLGTARGVSTH